MKRAKLKGDFRSRARRCGEKFLCKMMSVQEALNPHSINSVLGSARPQVQPTKGRF